MYNDGSINATAGWCIGEGIKDMLTSEVRDMVFSQKLQILRKNKGLTQEALTDTLGVSRQAVAK